MLAMRSRISREAWGRLGLVGLLGNAGSAALVIFFTLYLAPTVLTPGDSALLQQRSLPTLVVFTVAAVGFGAWWVNDDDDGAWIERNALPLKGKSQPVRIYAEASGD